MGPKVIGNESQKSFIRDPYATGKTNATVLDQAQAHIYAGRERVRSQRANIRRYVANFRYDSEILQDKTDGQMLLRHRSHGELVYETWTIDEILAEMNGG